MKMSRSMLTLLLLGATASVGAVDLQGLKDKLTGNQTTTATTSSANSGLAGMLGGASLPSMDSSVGGNAAGVLQYCVKNKYLSGDAASGIKDRLLGKLGVQSKQDQSYQQGQQGLLSGSDGKTFDLKSVSSKVKRKACDYVLDNAKSMI